MRFARRSNGMMAARKLFLRARKWPLLRWEAFAASAALEWSVEAKDQIPRNIYELGLKTFLGEPQYVLHYAAFLQGLGDTGNTRSLFERALPVTPVEAAGPLYDAYIRLEAASGSLAAYTAVEQRRKEALGAAATGAVAAAHFASLKFDCFGLSVGLENATGGGGGNSRESDLDLAGAGASMAERRRQPPPQRRRHRSRSRSRSPPLPSFPPRNGGGGGPPPHPPLHVASGDPSEPIRHFPRELAQLLNQLPLAPDGPVPDIEKVVEVILRMDFSPEGIEVHEIAASKERRRQRIARQVPAGGPGGGGGGGGGYHDTSAHGVKRKAEHGMAHPSAAAAAAMDDDSGSGGSSSDDDDDEEFGGGGDVYRKRMRARG